MQVTEKQAKQQGNLACLIGLSDFQTKKIPYRTNNQKTIEILNKLLFCCIKCVYILHKYQSLQK